MFDSFFSTILGQVGSIPLMVIPSSSQFWLHRFGIDLVVGGFINGLVASVTVIGIRTAINILTLGAARL